MVLFMNSMTYNLFLNFFKLFRNLLLFLFTQCFICHWKKNIFFLLDMIL